MLHRLKNNKGQAGDMIMIIIFLSIVTYYLVGFISIETFFRAQNRVLDIITEVSEYTSLRGVLSSSIYNDMADQVSRYDCNNVTLYLETKMDDLTITERNKIIKDVLDEHYPGQYNIYTGSLSMYIDETAYNGATSADKLKVEGLYNILTEQEKILVNNATTITYAGNEDIIDMSMKKGDSLQITATSPNQTLLGQILSSGLGFMKGSSKGEIISVGASVKNAIVVDGKFSGAEILASLSSTFENKGKFKIKTLQYDTNGNVNYENNLLKYNDDIIIDRIAGTDSITSNITGINTIQKRTIGQTFWINPNGTFVKKYEDVGGTQTLVIEELNPYE